MLAESTNNYRSVSLGLEEAKTEAETDYHPLSRRISTEQVIFVSVPLPDTEAKSLNNIVLPSIDSARSNPLIPLSQRLHADVERLI
jgi:hypothetical protein